MKTDPTENLGARMKRFRDNTCFYCEIKMENLANLIKPKKTEF